jgi:murein DD-endopeptidase MepM/ murein hydrolase activator NlpD
MPAAAIDGRDPQLNTRHRAAPTQPRSAASRVLLPPVSEESVLRQAIVAARRALALLHRDTTRPAEPPVSPAPPPAASFGAHRRARLLRLDSPERLVPVVALSIVLVASITAAPGLAGIYGPVGGTSGTGLSPRLVVGGEAGPFSADPFAPGDDYDRDLDLGELVDGGPSGMAPGSGADDEAAGAAPTGAADESVEGQFLADGTLLKPVVIDPTVEDSRDKLRTYTVQQGDTLTGIARRFGVSMMTVWWANKLKSKDELRVGQKLIIPPTSGLVITVAEGDTLEALAAKHKVKAAEIVEFNGLTDETLVLGQVLVVPDALGKAIATPKPTPRSVAAARPRTITSRSSGGTRVRTPAQYTGGVFAWPVAGGYISQYYRPGHPAIDIAADYGTAVRAAAAGTVIFSGWKSNGGGYQIWIAHGSGLYTTYNHLSSLAARTGERVRRAEMIGRIGTSGWSTGPHLHFEVWRGAVWGGGRRVNPLAYLR